MHISGPFACEALVCCSFPSCYCERAICSTLQSRRIRSRFHASRVNPRLGNHGADHPMAEQMILKQKSHWPLPAVLSTTAGATDVISFLALGGLARVADSYRLKDLNSTNGTQVNVPPDARPSSKLQPRGKETSPSKLVLRKWRNEVLETA